MSSVPSGNKDNPRLVPTPDTHTAGSMLVVNVLGQAGATLVWLMCEIVMVIHDRIRI
jgi:hypothetical protein